MGAKLHLYCTFIFGKESWLLSGKARDFSLASREYPGGEGGVCFQRSAALIIAPGKEGQLP